MEDKRGGGERKNFNLGIYFHAIILKGVYELFKKCKIFLITKAPYS